MKLTALLSPYDKAINALKNLDFFVPGAFRLILAPVMIVAGYNKLQLSKLGDSMEFAITYFFMGAGRFFSVDWWIRTFVSKSAE